MENTVKYDQASLTDMYLCPRGAQPGAGDMPAAIQKNYNLT